MHSERLEGGASRPGKTAANNVRSDSRDTFISRHHGPNRAQRRKLAALKRAGDVDGAVALLNVVVHRTGLAGNGDRSHLVRSVNARRRIR